ncbi:gamma-glutamylcyclotransferase family protein [Natrarchaeobaculum aegyptiacum]|uniref:Gamma-glutamylcyclotransferase AIG2-like domain-containing protein n=1 Tax=Natrarchaeobaculum aegyptiacum TaxID=745377 RepID=A0A2Z2HVM0_9EURY|nr:gamma-glutamylcyclotransferase family protein [Natrarchaeobaculum aegyptiacum]ARS89577.1 hypothetical protein B1756_07370 [Natrarchaeobaculum aegyptiacum]
MTGESVEPTSVRPIVLYGTLRRGSEKYVEFGLEDRLTYVGECTLEGLLYDLGEYPGLVLEPEVRDAEGSTTDDGAPDADRSDTLVTGELYRVDDETVVHELDAYEGYSPANPAGSLYVRQLVRLEEPPVDAWTYVYNRDVENAPVVTSGDWRAYTDRD